MRPWHAFEGGRGACFSLLTGRNTENRRAPVSPCQQGETQKIAARLLNLAEKRHLFRNASEKVLMRGKSKITGG
jgi:hypothetical protein